jgi:arginyl-tRNA synthetase
VAAAHPGLASLPPAERLAALREAGLAAVLARQARTLDGLGVRFDQWRRESALHGPPLSAALECLRAAGATYDLDGALWLRSQDFGDTEDRPLVRSNGQPSYLSGDLAYHQDKLARGFDLLLDVWGAEHAGYAVRTRAGLTALGLDPAAVEILIFQPVALRLDGMVVEGGPHGNTMLLEEVLEQVGGPAARLGFLGRPAGQVLEFDLDLLRLTTRENPAVALRKTLERVRAVADAEAPLAEPEGAARELLREVVSLPDELRAAAAAYEAAPLGADGAAVADAVRAALESALQIVGLDLAP